MPKTNDLTGKRYGILTVVKLNNEVKKHGFKHWDCLCDCGNQTTVRGSALKNGETLSCGCIKSKNNKQLLSLLDSGLDF